MSGINDYSQHGEGKIIADYFGDYKGTLVSLGENDGKTLSNVLGLIEIGWYAHLIEPSKEAFGNLAKLHRSNEVVGCYNFAIGNNTGKSVFHESGEHLGKGDTALLSSLIESESKKWKKETFYRTITDVYTWNDFSYRYSINHFDLISIDCEGMDYDILTQIDFNYHNTKMVVVESNNIQNEKYISHMAKYGFKLYYSNQCNLIFVK